MYFHPTSLEEWVMATVLIEVRANSLMAITGGNGVGIGSVSSRHVVFVCARILLLCLPWIVVFLERMC